MGYELYQCSAKKYLKLVSKAAPIAVFFCCVVDEDRALISVHIYQVKINNENKHRGNNNNKKKLPSQQEIK